jgi:two-component system, sensor histidine kinase and response regulator
MTFDRERDNKNIDILIAEDSATQAEQLKYLLEQEGYSVRTTVNGRQALDAARQRVPNLLISDIVMPEMDGYALCRAIKADQRLREVPVMIVTTLSSTQDITTCLECGADNFLRKPYDSRSLLARVDNLLSNWELRKGNKMRMGVEIVLAGKRHFITSEREQILDLLISSYEQAIQVNEELKQREREVRELNADLEIRAAELEAANQDLESFSYSVSHDLRAPLRGVAGCAGMIEEDFGNVLSPDVLRLTRAIRSECHRMAQLIEDLLAFSRLGRKPVKTQLVSLDELVSEVLIELRPDYEGSAIQFSVSELGTTEADPTLLKQALINLLSNAIKFTSKAERPSIELGSLSDPASEGKIYFVRDNGAGFDMRHAEKLFGVFERLHKQQDYQGTGVGLAIVKRIVQRHGGRVWAEGAVNRGATFYFSLAAK